MDRFDTLPETARHWLAQASLPWNPRSVERVWVKMIRKHKGDARAALNAMDGIETRLLARDAPKIWGDGYPARGGTRKTAVDHIGMLR